MEDVVILRCENYDKKNVEFSIKRVMSLLKIDTQKYKRVLIKPNFLRVFKKNQEAITTHPQILKSVAGIFKNSFIGESSFMETKNTMDALLPNFKNKIIFEEQDRKVIVNNKNKILKEVVLPDIFEKFDLIINVPKLKTHSLTGITCAIKNHYGFIPGALKQSLHKKAIGNKNFSKLLIDIFQNIKSDLHIVDAVVSMEGEGPSAGKRKDTRLILASKNAIALDIVAAKIMGFNPKEILMIRECIERGLYPDYSVNIIGDFKEIPRLNFELPVIKNDFLWGHLTSKLKEKIFVDSTKCTKCGICAKKCPAKCITLNPYPEVNHRVCMNCFCCIEVCPHHALRAEKNLIWKLGKKIKNIFLK